MKFSKKKKLTKSEKQFQKKLKKYEKEVDDAHYYSLDEYCDVEDDYNTRDLILKPKYRDRAKKLRVLSAAFLSTIAIGSKLAVAAIPVVDTTYVLTHQNMNCTVVENNLKYYGGGIELIRENISPTFFFQKPLVSHLKAPSNGVVTIGYDEGSLPNNVLEDLTDCIDYLNSIFEVINPKYRFQLSNGGKIFSDIWLTAGKYWFQAMTLYTSGVTRTYNPKFVEMSFGTKMFKSSKIENKLVILHEFLHVLFGCPDLNGKLTDYMTLLSYRDAFLIECHLKAKNSGEKKKDQPSTKYMDFTSYMPADLATLISVYGDSSKPENVEKYEKLLQDCIKKCREVLKDNFKYYNESNEIKWLKELDSKPEESSRQQ